MSHQPRIDWKEFERTAPGVIAALRDMGRVPPDAGVEKALIELVKVRVSQINGCAFCLDFHLGAARKAEVPQVKLDLVATFRDTPLFSGKECAALAWAEAVTLMASKPETDALYAGLQQEFSAEGIQFLTVAIANINAWNRIAGSLRFTPLTPA